MASATLPPPEAPEPVNSFGRIIGVIFSPKATFESIVRRPSWILPILLLTIVTLGVVGSFVHRVGWSAFFEKQDAASSRFQQASPEQQRQQLNAQVKYGPPFVYVIAGISTAIGAVIVAAILFGVFSGLMGAKVNFKTSMAIVTHAWVPGLILALLGILIIFVKDPSTVDLQNLVASNAGAFLASDSSKWLVSLLGAIDIFSFWYMSLMAIGFSAAAPKKLSFGKAFVTIFLLWAVYVVCRAGIVGAFS
jgi:hypothetical protein